MKPLTKSVSFISALLVLTIASACKKDSNRADSDKTDSDKADSSKAVIVIEGFQMKDGAGNDFGRYGPADNDWTFKNTLSDREMALFDFQPGDVNLNNTVEATISNNIYAFPNPCAYSQTYAANASDSVLMKVVVVNDKLNVLTKAALKRKGAIQVAINYSDTLLYPNKSSLRLYYSFSAQNKPNYKAGYGDIKICRSSTDVNSCFP
jgi:hypothetical protein